MTAIDEWATALFEGFDPDDQEGRMALHDIIRDALCIKGISSTRVEV